MTVDLKWRDAVAIDPKAFDPVERAAGWPGSMTPRQLASLQRLWVKDDPVSTRRARALNDAIQQSCLAGELPHEQREVTVNKTESRQGYSPRRSSIGEMWEPVTRLVQVPYQVQIQYVPAVAFAEWLRTQGEEPSQHIAHWFKVQGVAAAKVLKLVLPEQAIEPESGWTKTTPEGEHLVAEHGEGDKCPSKTKPAKISRCE